MPRRLRLAPVIRCGARESDQLAALGTTAAAAAILLMLWGISYGGVSVSTQNWTLATAFGAREAASAILVAVFNGAITLGALLGGRAVDADGVRSALWVGVGLVAAATILALASGRIRRRDPVPAK
ncbi:hypothetical protein [Nocardia sp. NPDC051570]|uniref:hypothetical protein n=1 Tax=Nocardia sp. NPDC051570 TaxID=3364324 RepID=UPI0037B349FB